MSDIENLLTPPWSRLPLVHDDTNLFPTATMEALRADTAEQIADPESPIAAELSANYVVVRTSDGHPLAPETYVVITLDKTLAQITANPVADIADITFEEA